MAEFQSKGTTSATVSRNRSKLQTTNDSKTKGKGKGKGAVNSAAIVQSIEDQQVDELYELDDWGSSWKICKESGLKWGGRGFGGRAAGRNTVQARDVVIEGCTMAYLGTNLLDRTTLRLLHRHRYGLIGRNGVGKSTLMRRIASGTLPGFPHHLRVAQVAQELPMVDTLSAAATNDEKEEEGEAGKKEHAILTPVDYILQNDPVRKVILRKIYQIENGEDDTSSNGSDHGSEAGEGGDQKATWTTQTPEQLEEEAMFLQSLYDMLEDENVVRARAVRILKDLGFSSKRRETDMRCLSGGWRMRVSIACALTQQPDVLLLDEPTNHLDLEGVEWLKEYLVGPAAEDITVLITSHDSNFLDDVCTDIIRFTHQQLRYYPGNYTAYEQARGDKELNQQRTQETVDRQRKQLEETIKRMQVNAAKDHSSSGKSSGQVASRKKKLLRHGAEKNAHGHRFRAQQDSFNGISSGIREGSMTETAMGYKTGLSRSLIEAAEREWKMVIPNPVPLSSLEGCPILQLKSATIGFSNSTSRATGSTATANVTSPLPSTSRASGSASGSGSTCIQMGGNTNATKSLGTHKFRNGPASSTSAQIPQTQAEEEEGVVVIDRVTLDAHQKSKIAILGKNGCGKSTLMKLIEAYGQDTAATIEDGTLLVDGTTTTSDGTTTSTMSAPSLMRGEVFKHHSLRTAYFQQHQQESLPYDQTPLAYLTAIAPVAMQGSEQLIRAHLGSFGLSGDLALQPIGKLSGGQKSRVVLAELTIHRPHLLLLDEPTNNLDLDSIRAMKEAIQAYQGAVVIASHDMAFVQATCDADNIFHLDHKSKRLSRLEGGTEQYKQMVSAAVALQRKHQT